MDSEIFMFRSGCFVFHSWNNEKKFAFPLSIATSSTSVALCGDFGTSAVGCCPFCLLQAFPTSCCKFGIRRLGPLNRPIWRLRDITSSCLRLVSGACDDDVGYQALNYCPWLLRHRLVVLLAMRLRVCVSYDGKVISSKVLSSIMQQVRERFNV